MAAKVRGVEDIDHGWLRIQKETKKFHKSYTAIGFFGGGGSVGGTLSNAGIAAVQEYGVTIKVTRKMWGFFLAKFGIPLKKTTITIPKRPFNRMAFDENRDAILDRIAIEYGNVLYGRFPAKKGLSRIGAWYEGILKMTMSRGSFAPNSALTIKQKGSTKPLIHHGNLRRSITHKEVMK